jgi:hypothetical protein
MITKEFLQLEYVDKKRTAKDIGKEISLSDTQVRYWVHKYGLPIHARGGTTKTENLKDKTFGCYTVLEQVKGNDISAVWKCQCRCGNICNLSKTRLKYDENRTCCKCPYHYNWRGHGEISGWYFATTKKGAKARKLEHSISIEYIWNLFLLQNRRCALSGRKLVFAKNQNEEQTASLDLIDSSIGYIEGNVQWLHKDVNMCKQSLSQEDFIAMCIEVASHKKNNMPTSTAKKQPVLETELKEVNDRYKLVLDSLI